MNFLKITTLALNNRLVTELSTHVVWNSVLCHQVIRRTCF